jgi:hypothetical protein
MYNTQLNRNFNMRAKIHNKSKRQNHKYKARNGFYKMYAKFGLIDN